MGEVNIHKGENKIFLLSDNEYETGVLTVPASNMVPAGALLKRASGKFAPVTNTSPVQINVADSGSAVYASVPGVSAEIPVAVNPEEIKNESGSPADIPFRALIGGRVRRDMLRSYGIIPKKVTDISWTEQGE
jgi:hypothetical protein